MSLVKNDNKEEAIKLISTTVVDVNYRSLHSGQTVLMSSSTVEMAELLLENGADANLQNREGNTALHFAVTDSNTPLCHVLMKWGADNKIRNNQNKGVSPTTIVNAETKMFISQSEVYSAEKKGYIVKI
jgi:ankyrin repeat protein